MLKGEYENMYQEISMSKHHRDDAEYKMQAQLADVVHFQKALYELERSHTKMKQHYEEEIAKLKHEVEERGGTVANVAGTSAAALLHFPTPPNLDAELQSFATGFTHLAGSPISSDLSPHNHGHSQGHGQPLSQLQAIQPQPGNGTAFLKRGHEEEAAGSNYSGRNVRARDDQMRRSVPGGMPYAAPGVVAARPATDASTATAATFAAQNGRKMSTTAEASGFDWLVVYNPKATRSIGIDLLHTLSHEHVVCCVRFSRDGKFLATGSNRIASIYNVQTGERMGSYVDLEGVAQDTDQYVRSVAFSPDGKLLVTGSEDQIVRVWDVAEQKLRCRLTGHSQDIYSVEFMPNGTQVVSGSGDRTVCIWDVATGSLARTLAIDEVEAGRDGGITSVAVSPNGKYIVAGSLDRTIRVWEVDSGRSLETLEGHRDSVYSVSFAPDGRHLISGSLDKSIKVWQFDSADAIHRGTCKYTILGHKDFVLSVAGTPPDGRWIVSGSKDRSVQFWDSLSGTTQLMLQGHKNSVISVAISPNGACFATGSGDCRARIWSYSTVTETSTSAPAVQVVAPATTTSAVEPPKKDS